MGYFSRMDTVLQEIQECIDRCRARGVSEHFISGLELAKSIVIGEESSFLEDSSVPESTVNYPFPPPIV